MFSFLFQCLCRRQLCARCFVVFMLWSVVCTLLMFWLDVLCPLSSYVWQSVARTAKPSSYTKHNDSLLLLTGKAGGLYSVCRQIKRAILDCRKSPCLHNFIRLMTVAVAASSSSLIISGESFQRPVLCRGNLSRKLTKQDKTSYC